MAEQANQIDQTVTKRGPGRPPRAQMEREQRRRRKGTANSAALDVPSDVAAKLAAEGLEGRWINDLGTRLHDKTVNDDWDKVPEVEPRIVGSDKRTGQPIKAYFCAKPKAFLEEDQRARMDRIAKQEEAIVRGTDKSELDEGSYQPKSANRIGDTI